ncbi:MAG: archease [Candidatus Bathyarchaeia archaeon]
MGKTKGFKFLEHTADVYIAAYGRNLAEAFEQAAAAMLEVTTDSEKVEPKLEDHVEITAEDEYALLYNWLEAILVKSEVNQMLYSKFEVLGIEKTPEGLRLRARMWGEPFNPEKHPQKVGVKAVTYHRMEIDVKPDKATVKFILDI